MIDTIMSREATTDHRRGQPGKPAPELNKRICSRLTAFAFVSRVSGEQIRVLFSAGGAFLLSLAPISLAAAPIDAHRTATYHFAITNTTDKPQTVESVRTSCACLKVDLGGSPSSATDGRAVSMKPPSSPKVAASSMPPYQTDAIPPGGVLPFDVTLDPTGMEGPIAKSVTVTLVPVDGARSRRSAPLPNVQTFTIREDVRLRLGFKPMDAAFGVIRRRDTAREIVARLDGYAAPGTTLGEPFITRNGAEPPKGKNSDLSDSLANARDSSVSGALAPASDESEFSSLFSVAIAPGGKSLSVRFRDPNILPGVYSEVWTIPTSDAEIPEIKLPVSARVADVATVTPHTIIVGWDEPVCSRMVLVRGDKSFQILSAETKPRKWGDVKITPRPKNGWRIDIANIDPREVRQFSKRPFLEVKTDLPGMESFEIPLRVVKDGGTK